MHATPVTDSIPPNGEIISTPSAQDALRARMATAVRPCGGNARTRWGLGEVRVADTTTYVKYSQGYESRVIADFKEGLLTVETVNQGIHAAV